MSGILPAASVLIAVLATGIPWGLPADATLIPPMVVVMMVFCWRALPGTVFPLPLALLLGFLTDLVSGGPLGFWALMALIAAHIGGYALQLSESQGRNRLWLIWAGVAVLVGALTWLFASLFLVRWLDLWPIAFGTLVSILIFPLVLRGIVLLKGGTPKPKFNRGRT
jgi:rod shape-determining protein MreD